MSAIVWIYEEKITLQKNQYEQDILSMSAIFSDTKEVLQLRNILVHDVDSMAETKGKYFPESNVYALSEINGFKYYQSKEDNLYSLFDNCNQKNLWDDIFDFKPKIELTKKQEQLSKKIKQYLGKKVLSKAKPTINYWIYDSNNTKRKSCFIEFKVNNKTLKTAIKNTLDFLMNPIFNTDNKAFTKIKKEFDKYRSKEVFEKFKLFAATFIRGAFPNRKRLSLENENLFFMDFFLPNAHIVLIGVLNKEDINFAILSNQHEDPIPNKTIENKITYWLSQYRIILNKNGTD